MKRGQGKIDFGVSFFISQLSEWTELNWTELKVNRPSCGWTRTFFLSSRNWGLTWCQEVTKWQKWFSSCSLVFKTCDSLLSLQASRGPDLVPPPARGWGFICNKFFWHLKPAILCHRKLEHYFCLESSSHIHAKANHSLGPWILKVHVSLAHYVLPV